MRIRGSDRCRLVVGGTSGSGSDLPCPAGHAEDSSRPLIEFPSKRRLPWSECPETASEVEDRLACPRRLKAGHRVQGLRPVLAGVRDLTARVLHIGKVGQRESVDAAVRGAVPRGSRPAELAFRLLKITKIAECLCRLVGERGLTEAHPMYPDRFGVPVDLTEPRSTD